MRRYCGMKHVRRWGAVYILVVLFVGSWAGQAWTMLPDIEQHGWTYFWAATFENWQSEWLQLIFQAILLLGAKHWLFQVDAADLERIEDKLDELLQHHGGRQHAVAMGDVEPYVEHDE